MVRLSAALDLALRSCVAAGGLGGRYFRLTIRHFLMRNARDDRLDDHGAAVRLSGITAKR